MNNKLKLILVTFLIVVALSGCGVQNNIKHFRASVLGLDRKIILYSANGEVIREWRTKVAIEDRGGTVYFIVEGKAVIISGTFTVEEM
jgi:uncharacterized lipoprotein YehR (DUF1307 family)